MPNNDPRYEVQDPRIKNILMDMARILGREVPSGWGFTLFLFSFGPGGHLFYISSANREDMISTINEWLAHQEKEKQKHEEFLKRNPLEPRD